MQPSRAAAANMRASTDQTPPPTSTSSSRVSKECRAASQIRCCLRRVVRSPCARATSARNSAGGQSSLYLCRRVRNSDVLAEAHDTFYFSLRFKSNLAEVGFLRARQERLVRGSYIMSGIMAALALVHGIVLLSCNDAAVRPSKATSSTVLRVAVHFADGLACGQFDACSTHSSVSPYRHIAMLARERLICLPLCFHWSHGSSLIGTMRQGL